MHRKRKKKTRDVEIENWWIYVEWLFIDWSMSKASSSHESAFYPHHILLPLFSPILIYTNTHICYMNLELPTRFFSFAHASPIYFFLLSFSPGDMCGSVNNEWLTVTALACPSMPDTLVAHLTRILSTCIYVWWLFFSLLLLLLLFFFFFCVKFISHMRLLYFSQYVFAKLRVLSIFIASLLWKLRVMYVHVIYLYRE